MDNTTAIIVVVCVVVVAVLAWFLLQKRRTQGLRSKFGPEYDRAMKEHGDPRKAEAALEKREKRVQQLHIITLTRADRDRFAAAWREDQARFVDDPKGAVVEADRLVAEVMKTRGYPMSDFEQAAADISVDHPKVVDNYRRAHAIAVRDQRGEANTEDLRKAMVHYRALFEELMETNMTQQPSEVRR